METLILRNMQFYAFHGVYPAEGVLGQWYRVDLALKADMTRAISHDDLSAAIDYEQVYKVCKKCMDTPSKLIEHAAGRLADEIFKSFLSVHEIKLCLSKPKPPLDGFLGEACIEINRVRPQAD